MDGTIILIIVATIMFAVIGGVTLASHIYNLNSIKSKTVGEINELIEKLSDI